MSCCDVGGRTKWGIFALLAVSAFFFTSMSGPSFVGILASNSNPESFRSCAFCVQDFGIEVLKSVNATDIAEKLQKIHERNEKNHPHFHHPPHHPPHHHHHHHHRSDGPDADFDGPDYDGSDFEFDRDECITNKDIDDLKPDLESLVIPEWKDECKDVCTPVIKAVPLAATLSGVMFFVGLVCGVCSIIPLCMLACSALGKNQSSVIQEGYNAVPVSAVPVGTYAGETSAAPANDSSKTPLLQKF